MKYFYAAAHSKYLILSTITREVILIILYLKMKILKYRGQLVQRYAACGRWGRRESRHGLLIFCTLLHLFTINYDSLVLYRVFPSSWLMHYRHCSLYTLLRQSKFSILLKTGLASCLRRLRVEEVSGLCWGLSWRIRPVSRSSSGAIS